jgi:hypothetical protein
MCLATLPLEIWSRVIHFSNTPASGDGSWGDVHWSTPKTLLALSLTSSPLYHESKREMLACIWIEFGPSKEHHHTILRGAAATYTAEDFLHGGGFFLTNNADRDLIRTIYCCIQVGEGCGKYPPGGRRAVKDVADHLLGYRRAITDCTFPDVSLTLVAEGRQIDWSILAGLTQELEGTVGIKIGWEFVRVLIHDGPGLYLHPIDDDDNPLASVDHLAPAPVSTLKLAPVLDDRDVQIALGALKGSLRSLTVAFTSETNAARVIFDPAAITTLGSLTTLSVRIFSIQDDFPSWFPRSSLQWQSPGGPLVWYLKLLFQILQSVPATHSLELLSISIEADLGYGANMDRFCQDFETVSTSISGLLRQPAFSSLKLDVKIQLRPTIFTAETSNLPDSQEVWGEVNRVQGEWDGQFDKNGWRVSHCKFRNEREKVDASFRSMQSALQTLGDRVSWCISSTEMSRDCEIRIRERAKAQSFRQRANN